MWGLIESRTCRRVLIFGINWQWSIPHPPTFSNENSRVAFFVLRSFPLFSSGLSAGCGHCGEGGQGNEIKWRGKHWNQFSLSVSKRIIWTTYELRSLAEIPLISPAAGFGLNFVQELDLRTGPQRICTSKWYVRERKWLVKVNKRDQQPGINPAAAAAAADTVTYMTSGVLMSPWSECSASRRHWASNNSSEIKVAKQVRPFSAGPGDGGNRFSFQCHWKRTVRWKYGNHEQRDHGGVIDPPTTKWINLMTLPCWLRGEKIKWKE